MRRMLTTWSVCAGDNSYGGYASDWSDDFEDGVINSSLWAAGGSKRGGFGQVGGDWQWNTFETGGYLRTPLGASLGH